MVRFMKKIILCLIATILCSFSLLLGSEVRALNVNDNVLIMDQYTTEYNKPDDFDTNCHDFAKILRLGGYIIFLVKILVPLILIFKASINLVSVVTSGKQEELRKQASKIMVSVIAGIIIFFIPTIINVIFGFVSQYNDNITEDSKVCSACVFEPFSTECSSHIEE